ncbi:MAG: bifunctional phosphoribosylaminoimidazolecarboxamide formyltransferase/IMP cyclohydrolase [Candidatus Thermoplasmatota archaeon]|nr:bifunctional phosphoribosylaminoimidazolecarboxamide formyltransferase/IMP cyclohydrolase [Candidatus Thermoplasmatota archaeon]
MAVKRALISVSDKTGIVDFAKGLSALGVEILSTGGTAKALRDAGVPVKDVSEYTGFPEMLDGRVKTLHPKIHGGILALRNPKHLGELAKHNIGTIDLVAVNLYPFEATIAKPNVHLEEVIENIDIGGPSMVRSAAKNHEGVVIAVNPASYGAILEELKATGNISHENRQKLAIEAYTHTAHYDTVISNYLRSRLTKEEFPQTLNLTYSKFQDMRYGENPHQKAAFYLSQDMPNEPCVGKALQLHGKHLSYNNILDADCAIECVKEFERPSCVIVKHATPCGIASAENVFDAYKMAYETDTYSPFGGIICVNRTLDKATALELERLFLELVIAPSFEPAAKEILEKKKNLRLLEVPGLEKKVARGSKSVRSVTGGVLVQDRDVVDVKTNGWKTVTKRAPTEQELKDMVFAVRCVRHIRSNAVVFVKNERTVGIGGGQTARVDASFIACHKGGDKIKGSIMASDAFFPFRDAVDIAAQNGVVAIAQPGGSIRDAEVIQAADEHSIAMTFTGLRVFRH